MSFNDYLKNRTQSLDKIKADMSAAKDSYSNKNENVWTPKLGSDNTGYAVVRFLPGLDPEKSPWVRLYTHGFKGPSGKWYIENSRTTIGEQDPVSEYNSQLWNTDDEANKNKARVQKRRTNYYANVYVVKDSQHPENDGQIKLYRFGQKIMDKIMASIEPEFEDDIPVNPFDIFEGANFRIKIKMVGGFWNYDSSDWEKPKPLFEDEKTLEEIFDKQHDVHSLVALSEFKSYEELQKHLEDVLNLNAPEERSEAPSVAETTDADVETPKGSSSSTAAADEEEDDLQEYFKKLSADD